MRTQMPARQVNATPLFNIVPILFELLKEETVDEMHWNGRDFLLFSRVVVIGMVGWQIDACKTIFFIHWILGVSQETFYYTILFYSSCLSCFFIKRPGILVWAHTKNITHVKGNKEQSTKLFFRKKNRKTHAQKCCLGVSIPDEMFLKSAFINSSFTSTWALATKYSISSSKIDYIFTDRYYHRIRPAKSNPRSASHSTPKGKKSRSLTLALSVLCKLMRFSVRRTAVFDFWFSFLFYFYFSFKPIVCWMGEIIIIILGK